MPEPSGGHQTTGKECVYRAIPLACLWLPRSSQGSPSKLAYVAFFHKKIFSNFNVGIKSKKKISNFTWV